MSSIIHVVMLKYILKMRHFSIVFGPLPPSQMTIMVNYGGNQPKVSGYLLHVSSLVNCQL
jgi:hypothetical protein